MAKILICDDDELYRQIAEVAFTGSGHELTFVENGYAALSRLKAGKFDLIVTDLVMPDKDGLEIIREIRDTDSNIPILAISGGLTVLKAPLLVAATALGANAVVEKPFRPNVLREQAEALLVAGAAQLARQSA
jgi:CheY-like chemotaxis protein